MSGAVATYRGLRSLRGLAWRGLAQDRARAAFSVLAVSFGVAMTIAGSQVAQSVRRGILQSEEFRAVMEGLVDMIDPLMAFVSVVIMLAAGFLIFNAFIMSVTRRRQEIGALRALGMARGQVMRLLLVEAGTVALTGTALGLLLAPLLGGLVIAFLRAVAGYMLVFEDAAATLDSLILAVLLGVGVPVLAVLLPARGATRIPPLAALRPPEAAPLARSPRWRAWLGLMMLGALLAHLLLAPPGEWATYPVDGNLAIAFVLLWLIGLGLLLAAAIGGLGALVQRPLTRLAGATGRLIADNTRRGRGRVALTVLTIAFALTMISGLSGFTDFFIGTAIAQTMQGSIEREAMFVTRANVVGGWQGIVSAGLDSLMLAGDEVAAIEDVSAGRAAAAPVYFAVVPELSFLGEAYFSYVVDPVALQQTGAGLFTFTEGDWEAARPFFETGCGVLVSPVVAARNDAGLGDTISVMGLSGPVDCAIAGIGNSVANASIIGGAARAQFTDMNPVLVVLTPFLGQDAAQIENDALALQAAYPLLHVISVQVMADVQVEAMTILTAALSGLLLLALLAAALGVVNTTVMSVQERRREIGLLRAVGSTRRQVRALIMGEAALMGLVGGGFGLVAGVGVVVVFVVTYGGNSWGITFDLWPTALRSAGPALVNGLIGLVAAPVIAALAAWGPTRRLQREEPIETLALR